MKSVLKMIYLSLLWVTVGVAVLACSGPRPLPIAAKLINAGAETELKNGNRQTPLDLALQRNHARVAEVLKTHRAKK